MNNKGKITIIVIAMVLVNVNAAFSTIRRVNNNSGVTGTNVYATFAAAYSAAVAGDTLLMEGSITSYGDVTLTKRLTIFGPGYDLNQNIETQASLLPATFGLVTFNVGSENSVISGCKITQVTVNANGVKVSRNFISNSNYQSPSVVLYTRSNIIIEQNSIWGWIGNETGQNPQVMIRNNIVGAIRFSEAVTAGMILNNTIPYVFTYHYWGLTYSIDVYGCTIMNNIVDGVNAGYGAIRFDATQNNTITYNLIMHPDPNNGVGSNNTFNVNMDLVFLSRTNTTVDKNWTLKPGSPAIGAGQNESTCGMTGGDFPYVLSGLPPIPHIYKFETTPAGNDQNPLQVKVSVKSQN